MVSSRFASWWFREASNRTNEETSEKAREEAGNSLATNVGDSELPCRAQQLCIQQALKPGANPWERVCELIDTNAKAAEASRFSRV